MKPPSIFEISLATYLLQAAGNLVIAGLLLWLHRSHPRRYLADWGWSWLALAGYHVFAATSFSLSETHGADEPLRIGVSAASLVFACAQLAWLGQGTHDLSTGRRLSRGAFLTLMAGLTAFALLATVLTATTSPDTRLFVRVGLRSLAAAIVLVAAAWVVRRRGWHLSGIGPRLLAGSFLVYGVDQLHYFVILTANLAGKRLASPFPFTGMLDFLLQIGVGIGMTVWLVEDERRTVERQAAELTESRRFLDRVLAASPHATYVYDIRRQQNVFLGDQIARQLGYLPTEIQKLGSRFLPSLLHPDDRSRVEELIERWEGVADGEVLETEYRIRHADGSYRWYLGHDTPFQRDLEGRIVSILGTAEDITDRKRAADELAERELRLRLLFEQMPVIVWSVDRELRIVSSAGSALKAIGLAQGELIGLQLDEYLGTSDPTFPPLDAHLRAMLGESAGYEFVWQGRDFNVRVEPLRDSERKIIGCVGVGLDVTEQRLIERQFPETQKLESLGVLAGGIAHDLNNLLTGVLGHAELAMRRLAADSAARPHLERTVDGAERAGELAHQLLAYAGRGEIQRTPLQLANVVRTMGDLIGVSIADNCVLEYDLDPTLPEIDADAAQIRQVVMNLITNGAEAIGAADGRLTITVRSRTLDPSGLGEFRFGEALSPGTYVALRVVDTGAGMDAETVARIFEPFFSTKASGRGLGLSAVLGIVRSHGGAIRVASTRGNGTTFEVLFPARAQAMAS